MTESTRAIAATVAALPSSAAQRFGDHLAARHRVDGEWRELTYAEVVDAIGEVALGLADLGIAPGDRVGILADTRLEWTLASYGISAAAGVVVPVYPTNSVRECAWVLGNSGARAVVCENADQVAKVEAVRGELPDLDVVVAIEGDAGDMTLTQLRGRGAARDRAELEERQSGVSPDDPYTIIYTSGTTGPPKGVVLTHANAMSVCEMVEKIAFIAPDETTYLFLPLAHAFALTAQLASYDQGTAIVYYGGDTTQILPELIETKPTYLPSVPRIFEKLYTAALKMTEAGSEEERERFAQAVKIGVEVRRRRDRGEEIPEEMQQAFDRAEEALYSRVRGLFGGNIHQAVTGAAPIAPDILEFFYACGIPVLEGWGMTETTAVGTVCTLDHVKFGTVGRPMPGVEIRIAEEDGEILVRGPHVFREYWRNPEAAHRRRGRRRRRGLPVHHRPQEGHHHHRRRQEPDAVQHRERPQAEPLHLPGGHARRPPALPGSAHHARLRGDPSLGQGAGAARGRRRACALRRGSRARAGGARPRQRPLRPG
jgi:long-chain acyl-CoA synthetase